MGLIRFIEVAGVQVHWQQWGQIGSRRIEPGFLASLGCALDTLWTECPWGVPDAILSHGAYVAKGGWHGKGEAFDLTGIRWPGQPLFVCGDTRVNGDWLRYIGIEAVLRRFIPQVLGWHELSGRHRHHWHLDARPVSGFQAHSHVDVTFAQDALNRVWGEALAVDGDYGPKTRAAEARASERLFIQEFSDEDSWEEFLALTSAKAFCLYRLG